MWAATSTLGAFFRLAMLDANTTETIRLDLIYSGVMYGEGSRVLALNPEVALSSVTSLMSCQNRVVIKSLVVLAYTILARL